MAGQGGAGSPPNTACSPAAPRARELPRAARGLTGGRRRFNASSAAARAVADLERLGERTITIDCDVLEADGGTRTAAITGAWIALVDCLAAAAAGAPAQPAEFLPPPAWPPSAWELSGKRPARPGLSRGFSCRSRHECRDHRDGPVRRDSGDRRADHFHGAAAWRDAGSGTARARRLTEVQRAALGRFWPLAE